MRVDKVIIRAVLSTLTAAIVLFLFATLALCFIFPSTMMQFTFRLGMNDASVKYAKRAYKYTGETYYLAYGLDVAIWDKDVERIAECGLLLLQTEDFDTYCAEQDELLSKQGVGMQYNQFVYGQVSVAKYLCGEKTEAVDLAFAGLEESTFPENNAVVAVLSQARKLDDKETVQLIKLKLDGIASSLTETDKPYFDEVYGNLIGA